MIATSHQLITYEQPVNESMRICLRLEHLFTLIDHFMKNDSMWHSRAALDAMLEIVSILERPDLKNTFSKELTRCHAILSRLQQTPKIDHEKLLLILRDIERINESLGMINSKLGQPLRENDFLTSIRMYRLNPGGVSSFDVPGFHYWMQQPAQTRNQYLYTWFEELAVIKKASSLLLQLVRQSSTPELKLATDGFFQISLDPKLSCQLIQVILPNTTQVYPELSVGRHRIAIRFYIPNMQGKPIQTNSEVQFKLTCCVL